MPHRSRLHSTLVVVLLIGCVSGCAERRKAQPVEVLTGHGPPVLFSPSRAYAEYLELPGQRNELRLTLTSYPTTCDRFVPPAAGETMVSVQVVLPPGQPPTSGAYPWVGPDVRVASGERATRVYADPSVRIGKQSLLFPAGGGLKLDSIEIEQYGEVRGTLAFHAPGSSQRQATSIRGHFRATLCRVSVTAVDPP